MSAGSSPPTARCSSCGWISVGPLTGCLNCGAPLVHRPSPQQAQPPAPMGQLPVWQPTHEAPRGGLDARAAPDPSGPVVTTLAAKTELQLLEILGAWGRVAASNGWTGWVDARELKEKR
jgi:hypothetical protein